MTDSLLIDQSPNSEGRYFVLSEDSVVLGRAPFAELGFESRLISRRHALITCDDGTFFIQDLDSANGTEVNGAEIGDEPSQLVHGDLISLAGGAIQLQFEGESRTVRIKPGQAPNSLAGDADGIALEVDSLSRIVKVNDTPADPPLSRKEFDVLELLFQASGQACSIDAISAAGWPERPDSIVDSREVSQLIRRIRRRIGLPNGNVQIDNVRGYGYRLSGL